MVRVGLRILLWGVVAGLLAACASAPPYDTGVRTSPAANVQPDPAARRVSVQGDSTWGLIGPVEFGADAGLPLGPVDPDALLASSLGLGNGDGPVQYHVRYLLEPGDVLAFGSITKAPTRVGGQRIGQAIRMQVPNVAGAPLSLGLTQELRDDWTVSGYSQSQRELAELSWSPAGATLEVQWAGPMMAVDPALAIDCPVRRSVRLPARGAAADRAQSVRLSGRDCYVLASAAHYADLEVRTWGFDYAWDGPKRESRVTLAVIDPARDAGAREQPLARGYELGLSHRRTHQDWTANALVALRQAPAHEVATLADSDGGNVAGSSTFLSSNAALAWHLPALAISAHWAHGADPLWFLPDVGQHSDSLGIALDLSQWATRLLPEATPKLAMNYSWSQTDTREGQVTGDTMVIVSMNMSW